MLRFITLLLPLLIYSWYALAQQPLQKIRGTVIDRASSAALPFVTVSILNSKYAGITDEMGNFELRNVPIGRYTIQVSLTGYEPSQVKEVQVSSSKEVFLTIPMKENVQALNEITITPQLNKQQALNPTATVSARMLSPEEARRYAGGFDDPARLVASFAGVSSNIGNNAIVVRGNSPQALQWKLEGVEIPNPNHFADLGAFGGGGLTALSIQVLGNSDFFSGAFPAEYNNALSGVFDLQLRNGNSEKREGTVQLGIIGIDASLEGPFKQKSKSSYLFNYRYSTLALLGGLLPDNAGGIKYQDFSFKLNFPTPRSGTFSLWGIGLIDRSGGEPKSKPEERKYDSDMEDQDVKQYMGAIGLSHKLFLNPTQYTKTTLASTFNGINLHTERLNSAQLLLPKDRIKQQNNSIVLSSFLNTKISPIHSNRTGFQATGLNYDILLKEALQPGTPLHTIVDQNGNAALLAAYSNSTFNFTDSWTMNLGLNVQWFSLNQHYTIEPRLGIKYKLNQKQAFSIAYGLHSRLERLNYYFIRNEQYGNGAINKSLDFSKAHHLVAGYDLNLSETTHLKLEAYYQKLFNIPVVKDSSLSLINIQNDWFFKEKLENTGQGENYGIDLSLERYLSKGYYYMLSGSVFSSRYCGGDQIWRSTRYNRNFSVNVLAGKEWQTGRLKQNVIGLNIRLNYQGGDHYSPIDQPASFLAQDAIFKEKEAFSLQLPAAFTSHLSASYRKNGKRRGYEIALKLINATMYKEFSAFSFNYQTQEVDLRREAIFIPNLSYKLEF